MTKILIVDDISENRYLLETIFKGESYEVVSAENGAVALSLAEASPPDLIMTDILMPVMDGFELCRRWKAHERLKTIPFVFYTATYTSPEDEEFALSLGADRFVVKPTKPELLVETVREVIEQTRSGRPARAFAAPAEEQQVSRKYSEVLFHKLEDKVAELQSEVDERKRSQEALRRSQEQLLQAHRLAHLGIWDWEAGSDTVAWSEELYRIAGIDPLKPVPSYAEHPSMFTPESWKRLDAAVREALRAAKPYQLELELIQPDGTRRWLNATGEAKRAADGRIVGLHGMVRDITDSKRWETERERLLEEARDANRVKDQFMAVLSHELRNPLAAISNSLEVLRHAWARHEPSASRAIDVIDRNTKLQARMVNDLLDLSLLIRGRITLQRVPIELGTIVQWAAEALRGEAERAGLQLDVQVSPGLWVSGDGDRLQQIVLNLVSNAMKFTFTGGRITVSLTRTEKGALVSVADTGIGIESSRLSRLFQMFKQGEVGGQRAPGLGIGLALVYSLAELHGGRAWAESAGPGRGSRFSVELPLIDAPPLVVPREGPRTERAALRVLVLEDNRDARDMLTEALSLLSYETLPAESGEAALELLAHEPVDAILADIGLPGMDGYQFLREARRTLPALEHVPALAVTGFGSESDVRRAQEAGFVGHFVKPVDLGTLDRYLRKTLGREEEPHRDP